MKTKYKYIEFAYDQKKQEWLIGNHKTNELIGALEFNKRWKEWEVVPCEGTGWTIECLNDLLHFINQLEK